MAGKKKMELNDVFGVVCRELPAAGVPFLMIGGHAVNFYGYSRATLDVDFMIVSDQLPAVRRIMTDAGFSNVSEHENVVFFNCPESTLRVDFLKADAGTMRTLLDGAAEVEYGGWPVRIPALPDLIAMKLFSFYCGASAREDKDFGDVVHLAVECGLDLEAELKPLCLKYADGAVFERLKKRITELKDAEIS